MKPMHQHILSISGNRRRARTALILVLVLGSGLVGGAQMRTAGAGVITADAPAFLLPDATRTPLAVLPAGTEVRVLGKEGDYYRVIFRDRQWGDRTAYVAAASVRIDTNPAPSPPPVRPPVSPFPPPATSPATPAAARSGRRAADRGYVSLNALQQQTDTAFSGTATFTQNAEPGRIVTNYEGAHPIVGDLTIAGRIWNVVALSVGVTGFQQNRDGAVVATVPHPFSFNTPRTVSGVATGLKRQEWALHLDPAVIVPVGRLRIAAFAGPSFFTLKQRIVTGVNITETYPFDTATFAEAVTVNVKRSYVGFNGGADVSVALSRSFGVGVMARYSRARFALQIPDTGDVDVQTGGLTVGGGIRFLF
jgi:hypothetical protein